MKNNNTLACTLHKLSFETEVDTFPPSRHECLAVKEETCRDWQGSRGTWSSRQSTKVGGLGVSSLLHISLPLSIK